MWSPIGKIYKLISTLFTQGLFVTVFFPISARYRRASKMHAHARGVPKWEFWALPSHCMSSEVAQYAHIFCTLYLQYRLLLDFRGTIDFLLVLYPYYPYWHFFYSVQINFLEGEARYLKHHYKQSEIWVDSIILASHVWESKLQGANWKF